MYCPNNESFSPKRNNVGFAKVFSYQIHFLLIEII